MGSDAPVKHVVFGVTGSIAAYKAAEIVRCLKKKGHRVSVIMTRRAQEFIAPLTFEILSEERVWCSLFEGQAQERLVRHISLAQDADALVIAPASANIIGKIANGIADDLLSTVAMATRAPVILAPAMNEAMYENPVVRRNCATLKELGLIFVGPQKGALACGTVGTGHIAPAEEIVSQIETVLKSSS